MPDDDRSIELLYVPGCPNHDAFLPHLRALLDEAGVTAPIALIEVCSDADAHRRRFPGSPTLRIDGVDVDPSGAAHSNYGLGCRLYITNHGPHGTPSDRSIYEALRQHGT